MRMEQPMALTPKLAQEDQDMEPGILLRLTNVRLVLPKAGR